MYFGQKEIEKIEGSIVTFKDGKTLSIVEGYKDLFTEEPMDIGKLQRFWQISVAKKLLSVLVENNVRTNDIQAILQTVGELLDEKVNEQLVKDIGKEKLDVFAQVFGASEEVPTSLSHRAIRLQDLFNS